LIIGLTAAAEVQPAAVAESKDDQLCEMCQQLIGQFLNKDTLEKLLQKAESYCDYLPGGLGDECKQMVDQYGQQIINQILSQYSAKKICSDLLHVCQGKQIFLMAGIPFVKTADTKQQDPCAMCKQLVGQLLNKNTLEQLLSRVESLCDKLPGEFATQCHSVIHQYGEKLIDSILAKYTPDSVCRDIVHVCSFDKTAAVSATSLVQLIEHPLLAKLMNQKSDEQLCATCMNVAGQLLTADTLNAILQKVDQTCDQLPGFVSDECHKLVQSEGKKVIDQILAKFTPEKVCKQFLHVCQK
jgi:cytidine deaminase